MKKTNQTLLAVIAAFMGLAVPANAAIPANGYYNLVNRATGQYIDSWDVLTNGDPLRNGNGIETGVYWGSQSWWLSSGSGFWRLNTPPEAGTPMYMDSVGRTGNGAVCGKWAGSSSNNQKFSIIDLGNGYYKIQNQANGLYLDGYGGVHGSDIRFHESSSNNNQQWAFVPLGVIFWEHRNHEGAKSQVFTPGTYNTAQMVAKGIADNQADSLRIGWPWYSVLCYDSGNLTGTPTVFTEWSAAMPGRNDSMSSLKVQTGYPAGITYRSKPGKWVEFRIGFLFANWLLMHRGDWVQLKSSGGGSKYTVRHETEYWMGSGGIVQPSVTVISGTNVLDHTSGDQQNLGTCTGTPFPGEKYYRLNGEVKWLNTESGCAYNLGLRDGGW